MHHIPSSDVISHQRAVVNGGHEDQGGRPQSPASICPGAVLRTPPKPPLPSSRHLRWRTSPAFTVLPYSRASNIVSWQPRRTRVLGIGQAKRLIRNPRRRNIYLLQKGTCIRHIGFVINRRTTVVYDQQQSEGARALFSCPSVPSKKNPRLQKSTIGIVYVNFL